MNSSAGKEYKYYAFISYNSRDIEWGKRLQRKLEYYRMPATLCNERGWERTPIKPVFFAPTDIQPNDLSEEIQERLRASRYLVVLCSPNSAQSEWVGKEIRFFHEIGRTKQILFFIIDGVPNSGNPETECFNPVIKELGLPEILGANIHEKIYSLPWMNKQRAYVQLISRLLQVEYDAVWQRHKRLMRQKFAAWVTGCIFVLAALLAVWNVNRSTNIGISLCEASVHNSRLPESKNTVITLFLDNETKTDTILSFEGNGRFENIPSRFLGKRTRIKAECKNYLTTDTTLKLSEQITINMLRNPEVYGRVRFWLYDVEQEKGVPHTDVAINTHKATSDAEGNVSLFIPLEEQDTRYKITSSATLVDSIITMPCSEDFIIKIKP